VQKDCRFVLGNLLEQGVERLQALVEAWRYGKGLLEARYPAMIPKSASASSAVEQENKGDGMSGSTWFPASEQPAPAAPFADAAERSATVSKTGEGQSGMRTERVTLEITYRWASHPSKWNWNHVITSPMVTLKPGESVRVVDGDITDNEIALTVERDAAIRERDTLKARLKDSQNCSGRFWSQVLAVASERDNLKARVAALEAASVGNPPETPVSSSQSASGGGDHFADANKMVKQPRGWLTEEERGSIQHAATCAKSIWSYSLAQELENILARSSPPEQPRGWLTQGEIAALTGCCVSSGNLNEEGKKTIRNLLARSSPPEVVLTEFPPNTIRNLDSLYLTGWNQCMALAKKAIAAAGVAVKEVGRE
jgi:hypothetical protein